MRQRSYILALFMLIPSLQAEELQENFVPIRALGMGNAFTAVANDETAIWTNPAGVARARKHRSRDRFFLVKMPNIGVGANSNASKLYNSVNSDSETSIAEQIADNPDINTEKPFWAHGHMFPVLLFNFDRQTPAGFGLFSNTSNLLLVEKETPLQTKVNTVSDNGAVFNMGFTNRTNRLNAAMQVRYISRYAYEESLPTNELRDKTFVQEELQNNANNSTAVGADIGFMYTLADYWFPTVGLSVLNLPTGCKTDYLNPHSRKRETVCGTAYTGDFANEDALSTIDPTDIRVGLSIIPRLTRKISLRLALDAHHLYVQNGDQTIGLAGIEAQKMLHAGAELFFGNPLNQSPFSLRVGVNQGFITSGFSIRLAFLSIDFATYAVDVSSTSSAIEDRRQVAGISLIF